MVCIRCFFLLKRIMNLSLCFQNYGSLIRCLYCKKEFFSFCFQNYGRLWMDHAAAKGLEWEALFWDCSIVQLWVQYILWWRFFFHWLIDWRRRNIDRKFFIGSIDIIINVTMKMKEMRRREIKGSLNYILFGYILCYPRSHSLFFFYLHPLLIHTSILYAIQSNI